MAKRDFRDGINATSGIIPIPAYNTPYDMDSLSMVRKPIDHYAKVSGCDPKRSTCKRAYTPLHIPAVGSCYGKHPIKGLNYNDIGLTQKIQDGVIAEIREDMNVYLNGVFIAESPKLKRNAKGKDILTTQPEKLRFCKAVIWALLNDEISLKDKLADIGYIPPVNDTVKDFMFEEITMSPYPGIGETNLVMDAMNDEIDRDNLSSLLHEELSDMDHEEYEGYFKDQNDSEIREYLSSITPVNVISKWSMPHLRISIIEECVPA
jgi:hypothetical protein